MILQYATPDGEHHTHAPPGARLFDADGNPFVWIRTDDGDVTRARPVGSA